LLNVGQRCVHLTLGGAISKKKKRESK